ncbi:hypothetical protein N431DRAFT_469841 [Stipitochalara longipes BDJ]|nr:hypothetical protein N431DRAFT_469841 [Stipitochalara longipes BDJ]
MAQRKSYNPSQKEFPETKKSSTLRAPDEDPPIPANKNRTSSLPLTEANLWMKSVIDAVHEGIQNRSSSKRPENDVRTMSSSRRSARGSVSGIESHNSSNARRRRDSREARRVESFLADTAEVAVPVESIEENDSTRSARYRLAAELDEFDETFESAGKNKPI